MSIFQNIIEDNTFLGLNRINRWSGKDTIKTETVGGHTHDVTIMIRALVEEIFPLDAYKQKLEIVTDAVMHDFDEVFSGDIVHKVKYNDINGPSIKSVLKDFCEESLRRYFDGDKKSAVMFLKSTTEQNSYSKDLVKVADWISMAVFCKKEILMGNTAFIRTLYYCEISLAESCDKAIESLCRAGLGLDLNFEVLDEIKQLNWKYEHRTT